MRRPAFWTLWLLVFTIPWENLLVLPGVGTVSRLVGVIAVSTSLLAVMGRGRFRSLTLFTLLVFLFITYGAVTFFWTIDVSSSAPAVLTSLQLALLFWLIYELVDTPPRRNAIMAAYVLGAYVSIGYTVIDYLARVGRGYPRYAAAGFDPNDLGLIVALGIPMSLLVGSGTRKPLLRASAHAYPFLAVVGIYLTASRGAAVAGIVATGTVIFAAHSSRFYVRLLTILALSLTVWLAAELGPETSWQRLSTIRSELTVGSLNHRRTIWKAGLGVWENHPWVGVGSGAYGTAVRPLLGAPYVAHNVFLSVAVERGLVGIGILVAILAGGLITIGRMPDTRRALWIGLLSTWMIGVMSLSWEQRKPTWLLLGLLASTTVTAPRSLHERLEEVGP